MSFAAFLQAYSADYQVGQANKIKAEGLAVTVNGRIWMSTHRQMQCGVEGLVISCSDDVGVTWKDVRSIDGASGGNFELCGDIHDVHHYPAPMMNAFERKMINAIGDYGGIGYPVDGHLWKITDTNWGMGKSFPQENRSSTFTKSLPTGSNCSSRQE